VSVNKSKACFAKVGYKHTFVAKAVRKGILLRRVLDRLGREVQGSKDRLGETARGWWRRSPLREAVRGHGGRASRFKWRTSPLGLLGSLALHVNPSLGTARLLVFSPPYSMLFPMAVPQCCILWSFSGPLEDPSFASSRSIYIPYRSACLGRELPDALLWHSASSA
jgi:hypothetical protein